jgi:hypothetical protein
MNLLAGLRDHPRWFFVACMAAGAVVSRLPFLAEPNGNIAVLPYLITWFACGIGAGLLVPDRPWRWGVAMAVGQPIASIAVDPELAVVAPVLIVLLPVVATPIVLGAYLGRFVSPGRTTIPATHVTSIPGAISSRLFLLFAAGLAASVIPVFFVPTASSALLIVWIGTAAAVAATAVAWARSGILGGTGIGVGCVMAGFITAVIFDTATGGPNHHMLPFEILSVTIASFIPAASLAFLTRCVVQRAGARPQRV